MGYTKVASPRSYPTNSAQTSTKFCWSRWGRT